MKKDFWLWHKRKSDIEDTSGRPHFHEREVWFASIGLNIGHEQDGGKNFLRPVVVVKKFNNEISWCVPLTKRLKSGSYYHPLNLNDVSRMAILSQMKLVDSKRFRYVIGVISENDFITLKQKLTGFLQ